MGTSYPTEGKLVQLKISGTRASQEQSPCERYIEFRIARRLESRGVLKRLCRVTLTQIYSPREPFAHVTEAFDRVYDSRAVNPAAPVGFDFLFCGSRAREHGAALFRTINLRFQNASAKSINAPAFGHELKHAMTAKEPSPIKDLAEYEVLVIDDIDAETRKNKWLMGQLIWLYKTRHDQQLTTILTSDQDLGEAFPGITVLKV